MGAKVIVSKLKGSGALTTLIGTRVFPAPIPETTLYPCVSYQLISEVAHHDIDTINSFRRANFQIGIFATSELLLYTISNAIIFALDGVSGTIEGVKVNAIFFKDRFENFEDEVDIRRMIMSFDLIYNA